MKLNFIVSCGYDFAEVVSELGSFRSAAGAVIVSQDSVTREVTVNALQVERYLQLVMNSDIAEAIKLNPKIMRGRKP